MKLKFKFDRNKLDNFQYAFKNEGESLPSPDTQLTGLIKEILDRTGDLREKGTAIGCFRGAYGNPKIESIRFEKIDQKLIRDLEVGNSSLMNVIEKAKNSENITKLVDLLFKEKKRISDFCETIDLSNTYRFSNPFFVSKIQDMLKDKDGISQLEQYVDEHQEYCEREHLAIALSESKSEVIEVLTKKLAETQTSFNLIDPRLEAIFQLYKIYTYTKQKDVLCDILENKSIKKILPPFFQLQDTSSTQEFLSKTNKIIAFIKSSGIQIFNQLEPGRYQRIGKSEECPQTLMVVNTGEAKGFYARSIKPRGRGTFKEVHEIYSVSGKKPLVQTHMSGNRRNKKYFKSMNMYYTNGLQKDAYFSKLLLTSGQKNVLKVWSATYKNHTKNFMELCDGKTIREYMENPGSMEERYRFIYEIAIAFDYMHEKKEAVHIDAKPENFLLITDENGKLKIQMADFGASEHMYDKKGVKKIFLRSTYPSPENMLNCLNDQMTEVDPKMDIWAFGDIIFRLLNDSESLLASCGLTGIAVQQEIENKSKLNNKNDVPVQEQEHEEAGSKVETVKIESDDEGLETTSEEEEDDLEIEDDTVEAISEEKEGQSLYKEKNSMSIKDRIKKFSDLVENTLANSEDPEDQFVAKMFSLKPEDRPTALEIANFFKKRMEN